MTVELAKFAGAETKMLPERFAKCGVRFIAGCQGYLGDIHCPHAQFTPGALHSHAANITGSALTRTGGENAMEVGNGKTCHRRKHFSIERFVCVPADVLFHIVDTSGVISKSCCPGHHRHIIEERNTCSLFQKDHNHRPPGSAAVWKTLTDHRRSIGFNTKSSTADGGYSTSRIGSSR